MDSLTHSLLSHWGSLPSPSCIPFLSVSDSPSLSLSLSPSVPSLLKSLVFYCTFVPLISNVLGLEMFRGGEDLLAGSLQLPKLLQPFLHSFLLLPVCLPLAWASQLVFLFELWKFSICHEQAGGQKARLQIDLKVCLCLCLYFSGPRDCVAIH